MVFSSGGALFIPQKPQGEREHPSTFLITEFKKYQEIMEKLKKCPLDSPFLKHCASMDN